MGRKGVWQHALNREHFGAELRALAASQFDEARQRQLIATLNRIFPLRFAQEEGKQGVAPPRGACNHHSDPAKTDTYVSAREVELNSLWPEGGGSVPGLLEDLCWAAYAIRACLPIKRAAVTPLAQFFSRRGVPLRAGDPVDPAAPRRQLSRADQAALREVLKQAVGKQASVQQAAVRQVVAMVRDLADPESVSYATYLVGRYVRERGLLASVWTEPRRLLEIKAQGRGGRAQVGYEIHLARVNGFNQEGISKIRNLLDQAGDDSDLLFFARGAINSNLAKALRAESDPRKRERLSLLVAEFDRTLAGRLEGHLDRASERRALRGLLEGGEISGPEFEARQAALATSRTPSEYAAHTQAVRRRLFLLEATEALLCLQAATETNAWRERQQDKREVHEKDVRNRQRRLKARRGRVAAKSEDREEVRQDRSDRFTQQAGVEREAYATQRAALLARLQQLASALSAGDGAGEKSTMRSRLAAVEGHLDDQELPLSRRR